MKASAFAYARATSVGNALELLVAHGDGAKVLSGGQSLMPAMNLRLLSPEILVDIGDLSELKGIERNGDVQFLARKMHEDKIAGLQFSSSNGCDRSRLPIIPVPWRIRKPACPVEAAR